MAVNLGQSYLIPSATQIALDLNLASNGPTPVWQVLLIITVNAGIPLGKCGVWPWTTVRSSPGRQLVCTSDDAAPI
ncbi:hypothetical protein RJ641_013319 [Dillenia turbinata]|uniref:Uncharacterized protein n=1 Tax=Dillenia turbinata TaxID=194707 RepID=A0AAN8W5P5_9MAGN